MLLRIALCDDEMTDLLREKESLEKVLPTVHEQLEWEIDMFLSSEDMLDSDKVYNMIFLDVEMDGLNGIETAEKLHLKSPASLIFFVTHHEDYMDEALNNRAFRFWVKPINETRLVYGIRSAIKKLSAYKRNISVTVAKKTVKILVNSIIYVYHEGRLTYIVTTGETIKTYDTFKSVIGQLTDECFFETHASCYVNLNYVSDYNKKDIICEYNGKVYKPYNARLNNKNRELRALQEEYKKDKTELSEYQLLAEKYENTILMRHDFHKQLDALKDLIAADNIKANEYMRQIRFSYRELDYAKYTNNKILNIIFAQKIKECHNRGVEIHIHSASPALSFISEIDTVAIFSNMLDNAIEAAEHAEIKEIYVDLYTVNNAYSAVKIENHTAKEPIVLDGLLSTQKENTDIHGMGIKSINNALKKYGSELTWQYDKDRKFFRAMALIHIPGSAERSD